MVYGYSRALNGGGRDLLQAGPRYVSGGSSSSMYRLPEVAQLHGDPKAEMVTPQVGYTVPCVGYCASCSFGPCVGYTVCPNSVVRASSC